MNLLEKESFAKLKIIPCDGEITPIYIYLLNHNHQFINMISVQILASNLACDAIRNAHRPKLLSLPDSYFLWQILMSGNWKTRSYHETGGRNRDHDDVSGNASRELWNFPLGLASHFRSSETSLLIRLLIAHPSANLERYHLIGPNLPARPLVLLNTFREIGDQIFQ